MTSYKTEAEAAKNGEGWIDPKNEAKANAARPRMTIEPKTGGSVVIKPNENAKNGTNDKAKATPSQD